jgi:uncharacterized membrane protein YfcA
VGNASRIAMGFRQIYWRAVFLFLATGLPGAILGAYSFVSIPKEAIVRLTGAAILVFVLLRLRGRLRFAAGARTLLVAGGLAGFLSGLVGSAGPLGPAVFLSLELPPLAYIASDATTSLIMHSAKTVIYQKNLQMPSGVWLLALLLGVAMVLGTQASRYFIERLHPDKFRLYVTLLLGVIALEMIIFG